jgi:enoyl-CoA hydratase/carnithine racemase
MSSNRTLTNDVRTHVRLEAGAVGECAKTEDFVEGVSAFLQGRMPQVQRR